MGAPPRLTLRIGDDAGTIRLRSVRQTLELSLGPRRQGAFREAEAILEPLRAGDVLTLEAVGSEYRAYHVWITR